jgi:Lrp/AsnC family leucine-responsive transcriptional regulator
LTKKTLLDDLDIAILKELQKECRITLDDIANKIDAPASTIHYRLKRLERAEVIEGYYAKVNPEKLDIEYITVIQLRVDLAPGNFDSIGKQLAKIPGVWAAYVILGDYDFLIMTRSKNREEFLNILNQLHQINGIKQSSTAVVAKLIKEDPRLDLE